MANNKQQKFGSSKLKQFTFSELKSLIPHGKLALGDHESASQGVCLMEAVAWVAGEEHSDHPQCADGELATFAIGVNDGSGPKGRQDLIRAIPFLVNSKTNSKRVNLNRAKEVIRTAVKQSDFSKKNKGRIKQIIINEITSNVLKTKRDFVALSECLDFLDSVNSVAGAVVELLHLWNTDGISSGSFGTVLRSIDQSDLKNPADFIIAVASVRS